MLRVLARERMAERATELGQHLELGLKQLQERHEVVGDVRGRGLLWGVEVVVDRHTRTPHTELGARVTRRCLDLGLNMNIVNFTGMTSVWRFAPPLVVTREEIDSALSILDQAICESL